MGIDAGELEIGDGDATLWIEGREEGLLGARREPVAP